MYNLIACSSQVSISINSYTELSKTQFFPASIVNIVFQAGSLVLSTTGSEPILYLLILRFCTTLEKNSFKYYAFISFS